MTITSLHDPSHREALWELEAAFERRDLIQVFGRCTVSYEGRAASHLGPGDRLLLLKPDGAALVHTDEGREPVNWQPPGSEHHAAVRDGRLRVRSTRTTPDESLTVRFSDVHQLSAMAVTGGRDLELHGSEADLRIRILERPELVEPGFEPRETERPSSAGPMDVFGVDADGNPVVVELKRRRVGPDAVGQLARYVRAVREELGAETTSDGDVDSDDGDADPDAPTDIDAPADIDALDDIDAPADIDALDDIDAPADIDALDDDPVPADPDPAPDDSDTTPVVRGILVAPSVTDRAAERLADRGFDHVALEPTPGD